MKYCTKCILPDTYPNICFNSQGVCNFCLNYTKMNFYGEESLFKHVDAFRSIDGRPDCLVALSGGRDSSYGLHYVKNVLKMNPIAFTYDWGMITDLGRRNQARMVGALGVEHIVVAADIEKKRKNIKKNILAWLKRPDLAMIPLFMAGDKMADLYAKKVAKENNIKLVIFCRGLQLENDEFKWGYLTALDNPTPKGVIHDMAHSSKLALLYKYATKYLKNRSYFNSSFLDTLQAFYATYFARYDFCYLWHYIPWSESQIIDTLTSFYGWEKNEETQVTWRIDDATSAFYNYVYFKIGGFTENDSFRSNQIREGLLSRDEAFTLVQKENKVREGELDWYFNALNLSKDRVLKVINEIKPRYTGQPYLKVN